MWAIPVLELSKTPSYTFAIRLQAAPTKAMTVIVGDVRAQEVRAAGSRKVAGSVPRPGYVQVSLWAVNGWMKGIHC